MAEITSTPMDLSGGESPAARADSSQPASAFTAPALSQTPLTFACAVSMLDSIPGVDQRGMELLVAEWGSDRGRFGTAG